MIFKIKPNDNLIAIYTYLRTYEYYVDLRDLIDWCIAFEYYKELYENFHIIVRCLEEHNIQYPKREPKRGSDPDEYVVNVSIASPDDDDSLL